MSVGAMLWWRDAVRELRPMSDSTRRSGNGVDRIWSRKYNIALQRWRMDIYLHGHRVSLNECNRTSNMHDLRDNTDGSATPNVWMPGNPLSFLCDRFRKQ